MIRFLAPALLAVGPTPANSSVDLRFAPRAGAVVVKQLHGALELVDGELSFGSGDGWRSFPWVFHAIGVDGTLRTVDEYVETAGGHPIVLKREYDLLRSRWALGLTWGSERVLHPLTFRTVVFERAGDGAYDVRWERKRRSGHDVLEKLSEDMDYRALLPDEAVEVGDVWYVPFECLGPVLMPGGRIHRNVELWDALGLYSWESGLAEEFRAWYGDEEATCELVEVRRGLARVSVEIERRGDLRLDDYLRGRTGDPYSRFLGGAWGTLDLDVRAEAELVWDLERHHVHAFELDGTFEAEIEIESVRGFGLELTTRGRLHWDVQVEAEDEP